VDLVAVIETLAANHIHLPLVLRFPDILHHRMLELQTCFSLAAAKFNYKGLDMGWIKVGMSRVSMIHIFFFCLLEDCFRFCLFGEWDGIMED
jgi:hypothetical protein